MSPPRQPESKDAAPRTGFVRIEQIGDDGLRVRTIWTPFPAWLIPVAFSLAVGLIAILIASAMGAEEPTRVGGFAVLAGYLAGAILWAVIGAAGGDRQEIFLDGQTETGQVDQRLLWIWGRNWDFEMDDVERIYVWMKRGRFLFRLNQTHYAAIGFYERPPLSLGTYHTDHEVMAAAVPLGTFIGVPVRRNEQPPKRPQTLEP